MLSDTKFFSIEEILELFLYKNNKEQYINIVKNDKNIINLNLNNLNENNFIEIINILLTYNPEILDIFNELYFEKDNNIYILLINIYLNNIKNEDNSNVLKKLQYIISKILENHDFPKEAYELIYQFIKDNYKNYTNNDELNKIIELLTYLYNGEKSFKFFKKKFPKNYIYYNGNSSLDYINSKEDILLNNMFNEGFNIYFWVYLKNLGEINLNYKSYKIINFLFENNKNFFFEISESSMCNIFFNNKNIESIIIDENYFEKWLLFNISLTVNKSIIFSKKYQIEINIYNYDKKININKNINIECNNKPFGIKFFENLYGYATSILIYNNLERKKNFLNFIENNMKFGFYSKNIDSLNMEYLMIFFHHIIQIIYIMIIIMKIILLIIKIILMILLMLI